MRMRPHIGLARGLWRQHHRAGMVEEDERPDRAPRGRRQQSAHEQTMAQIDLARGDHGINHRAVLC